MGTQCTDTGVCGILASQGHTGTNPFWELQQYCGECMSSRSVLFCQCGKRLCTENYLSRSNTLQNLKYLLGYRFSNNEETLTHRKYEHSIFPTLVDVDVSQQSAC
jgi:hypothetical protein